MARRPTRTSAALVQLKFLQGIRPDEPLKVTSPIIIDELIEKEVGSIGIWQGVLVLLAIISTTAASTFPVFSDTVPRQRCNMGPAWESAFSDSGLSFDQIIEYTSGVVSSKANEFIAGCSQFEGDWFDNTTIPTLIPENATVPDIPNFVNETVYCQNGYIYEYHPYQYQSGIVAEFHLVCDQRWLVPIGTSVFMVGMMLGYLVSGFWSARFGRKNCVIFFSLIELICSIASSLVNQYWLYTVLRFLVAFGAYGKLSGFNLILLEITLVKYHSLVSAIYLLGFNFSSRALQAMFAYILPYWRWMSLAATFHCAFALIYYFVLPESPRWLLDQGRTLEAIAVLQRGRRVNSACKKDFSPSKVLKKLEMQESRRPSLISINSENIDPNIHRVIRPPAKSNKELVKELFTNAEYRRSTIVATAIFFMYSLCFTGLLQITRMVRENIIMVAFLNGAVTIPGVIMAVLTYRLLQHRRAPAIVIHVLCSTALCIGGLYTMIAEPEEDIVLTVTVNIGLMFYATIQCLLFVYVPELFPPNLRSQAFGISAGLGRIASATSLYVNELDVTFWHASPIVIYGGVTLVSVVLLCFLSDTTGEEKSEPEAVEGEADGDYSCHRASTISIPVNTIRF